MSNSRKSIFMAILLYSFSLVLASLKLTAIETTMILGASAGWQGVEKRVQVEELEALRPYRVLALSSAWTGSLSAGTGSAGSRDEEIMALYAAWRNFPAQESAVDLALDFDETAPERFTDRRGRYQVQVSPAVQSVNGRWARYGRGAALFSGNRENSAPVTVRPGNSALFTPGRNVRDFSLEFWAYPNAMENGEQLLSWAAVDNQRIFCEAQRNRLRWTFQELFSPPGGRGSRFTIILEGRTPLVPRTWSHHLIRYNADSGLLEYLINGQIENIAYTTASGREGGDVYTPRLNRDGAFVLGSRFSGILDEFRIYNKVVASPGRTALENTGRVSIELPELAKFPRNGGRIETRTLDLGERNSMVLRIEASGGRMGQAQGQRRMAIRNIYAGRGNFRFPDNSMLQFFIRAGEEPYQFSRISWTPIVPGEPVPETIRGRYVQVAAAFYPSGDCETSPYLEEIRIIYDKNEAPYPPSLVTARALNGAVDLAWRPSPDEDTRGYLIYYGTTSGVYYGEGARLGSSPIDAGNRTSLRIEGLQNGTLYFFVVAAYDGISRRPDELHPGKFSKEVAARPLRMNE
ncbi:MAG: hypothetical protein LBP60_09235 [Spirochaetaceae bacterium]|nr:hypothetical protein [Spirochaetaceae bacterium]